LHAAPQPVFGDVDNNNGEGGGRELLKHEANNVRKVLIYFPPRLHTPGACWVSKPLGSMQCLLNLMEEWEFECQVRQSPANFRSRRAPGNRNMTARLADLHSDAAGGKKETAFQRSGCLPRSNKICRAFVAAPFIMGRIRTRNTNALQARFPLANGPYDEAPASVEPGRTQRTISVVLPLAPTNARLIL